MGVFATKEAELCAYMDHNGWGMEDLVALNMLKQKKFTSEDAAQLLLVSRRTGRRIEDVMMVVLMYRVGQTFQQFSNATRRTV